jgi:hypothetical protein
MSRPASDAEAAYLAACLAGGHFEVLGPGGGYGGGDYTVVLHGRALDTLDSARALERCRCWSVRGPPPEPDGRNGWCGHLFNASGSPEALRSVAVSERAIYAVLPGDFRIKVARRGG